jgi:tetratricopeptide (TPR) repeat protein
MYWIIGVVGVLVLLYFWWTKSPVTTAMALIREGQRARERRDWPAVVRFCRQAHDIAKTLPESVKTKLEGPIEVEWANASYRLGKMSESEELFRGGFSKARAAGVHATQNPAYLIWGDLCADEGRHPEAEQHYRTALATDEQTGNLAMMIFDLQRVGDSLIRQGRRSEAEEVINQAIALETRVVHEQMIRDGKNPAEHHVVSWSMPDLLFCREQFEDARRVYREKVTFWEKSVTRPDNIDLGHLQMRLAFAEARTGHRAEAVEMYTRAEATFAREWCERHPRVAAARAAKEELMQAAVES